LFYAPSFNTFAVVSFTTQPSVEFGNAVAVPGEHILGTVDALTTQGASGAPTIQVILNWFEELRARVP